MGYAQQILVTETLEPEQCYKCAVWFAFPHSLKSQCRANKQEFYCPNGHGQIYSKSEVEKLRESLAAEEQRHRNSLSRLNETVTERDKLQRKLKRVDRGVCPECKRTFQNLARHMACKHKKR